MTTFRTTSQNLFNKIRKYIKNKHIAIVAYHSDDLYIITLPDLSSNEVETLVQKMSRHLHLTRKQHVPLALAA